MAEERPEAPASADHGRRVASMFGRIAPWYDFLNHGLSLGQDIHWRKRLVRAARIPVDGLVLDLAAGTLDVSIELARAHPRSRILAMDFALPMLMHGRDKLKSGPAGRIAPIQADGRRLPLPDACVDAVTIAFGIRNILPREEAYAEALRVLKPGGRFLILEFGSGKSRIWNGIYNFYLNSLLPLAGRLVSGDPAAYRYLADTINAFPTSTELSAELVRAGFSRVMAMRLMSGIVYIHVAEKSA